MVYLLLADDEVNDAEVQQVQQLIDTLHAHVHSSDVQVRQCLACTYLVRDIVAVFMCRCAV